MIRLQKSSVFAVHRVLSFALAVVFASHCTASLSQVADQDRSRIIAQIEHSKTSIVAERFPDVESAKQDVLRRIRIVRGVLVSQTAAANAQAWLKYLDTDPITEAIAEDESVATLANLAFDLRHRLVGNARGLEIGVIRDLRSSVETLIAALRFRDPEKATESLRKQLTDLSERVEKMDQIPSSEDASAISSIMGLIDESNQASELVSVFQEVFGRPNLAVFVGEPLVERAVNRAVNESRPVRDCILGTQIVGSATTQGNVTATLLPSIGDARIQVALFGHVTTNSLGYNGPVRLRTTGSGQIAASRVLHVNEQGVTLDPIYATAALSTQINAIEHPLRIVRRIATRKAAEQKPKADQIAVAKLQTQVSNEFANQTREASGIKPPDVAATITPLLNRLSLQEPTRLWGSTEEYVFIDATVRKENQIASAVTRPRLVGSFDIAVQVEESLVDNVLGPLLAGRTVKENEINDLLDRRNRDFDNQDPSEKKRTENEARDENEEPSFELDFARLQPIVFEARQGSLRLGIRGTRFSTGARELKVPMEITATYRIAKTDTGNAILVRDQEIDVHFPGRKRLTVSQAGLKRNIQEKFAEVFPPTLLDRTFTVPPTVEFAAIQNREFRAALIDARKGWLTIAVQ